MPSPRIAVLVPCRNEEAAVVAVIRGFKASLPGCTVYVYDNASTDRTAELARAEGAVVRHESTPGKGGVVRRMFAEVDADIYVIVDGDATYEAAAASRLVAALVDDDLDMVVGVREDEGDAGLYRRGHRAGNRLFNLLLGSIFGRTPSDMLSGYRVFSRRFVKSFPATAHGFEIETELTVHSLQMRVPIAEIATRYAARPEGSQSKLNTYRDGMRILAFVVLLFKEVKPFAFFGILGAALFVVSLALGIPVVIEFLNTGLVPRLPTAVLATGVAVLASLSVLCGVILDSVARGRAEAKRLAYLAQSGAGSPGPSA